VSVCFPAFNEEATIRAVLDDAHARLSSSPLDYEIIVCDDASTDGTRGVIADAVARCPRMRAIYHAENQGIRATFEELYREATKAFVFLNSTDGQWDTSVLFDLLPLTPSADIVIASRRHKHYTPTRAIVSWGFNLLPRLLFGVHVGDAGAVKLVRRDIIERFTLVSKSPFSEAERLVLASRAGYRIAEVPTDTHPRSRGKARGASRGLVLAALADVARVWRRLRRERRAGAPSPEESSHAHRR
jgi:glycosyltransferase involved in cell wall biosynthesis